MIIESNITNDTGFDIARYESERRTSLIEARRDIEDQISTKYAEIRTLMDARSAVVMEIVSSLNRNRYEFPEIAKPQPNMETPARKVFLNRFLGRISGSVRRK